MTKQEAIDKVLALAKAELGVEEHPRGSNSGKRVNEYLTSVGFEDDPEPWCAAFVCWVLHKSLGEDNPIPMTADCDVLLAYARKRGVLKTTRKRGDIFLRLASQTDARHTGFCTDDDDGTIEGNTNPGGSREGYGVFARKRGDSKLVFVRWADLLVSQPTPLPAPAKPDNNGYFVLLFGKSYGRVMARHDKNYGDVLYVPARSFVAVAEGTSLEDAPIGWEQGNVVVNNQYLMPWFPETGSTAWVPLRRLCNALNLDLTLEGKLVTIAKSPTGDASKDEAINQGVK
jgi:hypothetical protein